jgi:uncharacterized protein YecE (DUF72 family)
MIRVGTAGWSYDDWKGIVYPERSAKGFQPLSYLSKYFDTIEINSTFYRPPTSKMSSGWVRKTHHNPNFRFTLKLWRGFTHEREKSHEHEEGLFKTGLMPLTDNQLLGALLIQFPFSFKYTSSSIQYLESLITRFEQYPLVIEVRHASFARNDFFDFLRTRNVGFCNIDQPIIGYSLKPSSLLTSRIGYVRFHGRNYKNWFAESSNSALRYDYLYSPEELEPWLGKIQQMAHESEDLFVIQNNHFRGKGACNGLELKHALSGKKIPVPPPLAKAYPERLSPIMVDVEEEKD